MVTHFDEAESLNDSVFKAVSGSTKSAYIWFRNQIFVYGVSSSREDVVSSIGELFSPLEDFEL